MDGFGSYSHSAVDVCVLFIYTNQKQCELFKEPEYQRHFLSIGIVHFCPCYFWAGSDLQRKKIQAQFDIMLQISLRRFSLSFTQKIDSPDYTNYSSHNVGNISFCMGW